MSGSLLKEAVVLNRVDRERIATLIGEARKALGFLHQHGNETEAELLSSGVKLGNIKYQFIVAIESCIDLCTHIAARLYVGVPESYAGCFDLLVEGKVIGEPLARDMADFARFRNILVHRYWEIDNGRVVSKLKNDLGDVEEFLSEVARFTDQ